MIVMGTIIEKYGVDHCFDKWAASEAVEILKHFGLNTIYVPRYMLGVSINRNSFKGKLTYFVRFFQRCLHRLIECPLKKEDYSLRYLSFIDMATYQFIATHSDGDYFLHAQDYLNWVLQYPFTISAPLMERVTAISPFSPSEMPHSQYYAVQVVDNGMIIGFYMLKRKIDSMHILYLYFKEANKRQVYASIRDHVKRFGVNQCVTENLDLADYLMKQIYFPKCTVANISLSYPSTLALPLSGKTQYGDCDNFMV